MGMDSENINTLLTLPSDEIPVFIKEFVGTSGRLEEQNVKTQT
jgi:hypothetical protein